MPPSHGLPWYHQTPEEITHRCLGWVYQRLHGGAKTVVEELLWMHDTIHKNHSHGQPQRTYCSLSVFLACVVAISTPVPGRGNIRHFDNPDALRDLIDHDLIPSLAHLITTTGDQTSVSRNVAVTAVREWTATFFVSDRFIAPWEATSTTVVKFRTCEHEGCPLSSLTPIWPRTVAVLGNEKSGFKRCSRCKQTSYCSRACQRANWVLHKDRCGIYALMHHASTLLSSNLACNSMLRKAVTKWHMGTDSERCTVAMTFPNVKVLEKFSQRPTFDNISLDFLQLADVRTIHDNDPSIQSWILEPHLVHYGVGHECPILLRVLNPSGGCEILPHIVRYIV